MGIVGPNFLIGGDGIPGANIGQGTTPVRRNRRGQRLVFPAINIDEDVMRNKKKKRQLVLMGTKTWGCSTSGVLQGQKVVFGLNNTDILQTNINKTVYDTVYWQLFRRESIDLNSLTYKKIKRKEGVY